MKHMPEDPDTFDPTDTTGGKADVSLYNKGDANLAVGELIICNDSPDEQGWFVAQVQRRKPNEIVVRYYHTPTPFLEEHDQETNERRLERLNKVTFRKTWIITNGKNHGKATSKPPYPKNEDLRTWDGTIPLNEIYDTVLIRGVKISAEGKLSPKSFFPPIPQVDRVIYFCPWPKTSASGRDFCTTQSHSKAVQSSTGCFLLVEKPIQQKFYQNYW